MSNTIIGVFDNYAHAAEARNALLSSGFDAVNASITPSDDTRDMRQAALERGRSEDADNDWSISGFFRALFGSSDNDSMEQSADADMYSEAIRRGSYLLRVEAETDDQHDRAVDIMNRYQPVDIDDRAAQWRSQGWTRFDSATPLMTEEEIAQSRTADVDSDVDADMSQSTARSTTRSAAQATAQATTASAMPQQQSTQSQTATQSNTQSLQDEVRIPVVEEQVKIGKRAVTRGGVRVYQRVSETPVQEQVQLREEHITVERRPADQAATEADLGTFKEGVVELRESAEEAVVAKSAKVVEEVVVGKEVRDRTETVSDTVRRTDVEIEQLGAAASSAGNVTDVSTSSDNDSVFRSHWQNSYAHLGGRYEDYVPAYQYGSQLAGSQSYQGSKWVDVEPEVQRDWESRYAGTPWEKAKDAVRAGWEKMTK